MTSSIQDVLNVRLLCEAFQAGGCVCASGLRAQAGCFCGQASHPAETSSTQFWSFFPDPGLSLKILMLCFSGFSGFQPGNSSGGRKLYPVYQQTR